MADQQVFSTGQWYYYLGTANAAFDYTRKNAEYFGTSVGKPSIQLYRGAEMVHSDLSGSVVPFDLCWQGVYAIISVTMSRFDYDIFDKIQAAPNYAINSAGSWTSLDVGTMLAQENMTYPIWIVWPRQALNSMAAMVPGFRFWNCYLAPNSQISIAGGTSQLLPTMTWYAWPSFTSGNYPASTAGQVSASPVFGGAGAGWVLYDNVMLTSNDYGATTTALPTPT